MIQKLMAVVAVVVGQLITYPVVCCADEVKIGVIVPLTGSFARYGEKIQKVISAFDDEKVQFVFEDEGCDPKVAVTAYKKLVELDGIKLFLGPWCGSPQSAIAPLLKSSGHLAVVGASTPEAVFDASGGRIFSTQASIEEESKFLAEKLNDLGVSSVATVFRENAFSRAHEAAFIKNYKGTIVQTFAYSSDDPSELKSIALRIKQLQPAALYIPDASPLLGGLAKDLRLIGVKKKIYSIYSVQSDDVMMALGQGSDKLIYSYPDIGQEEALHYFPAVAAKLLVRAAVGCNGEVQCVRKELLAQNNFNQNGILSGSLGLRMIRDGKFVEYGGVVR